MRKAQRVSQPERTTSSFLLLQVDFFSYIPNSLKKRVAQIHFSHLLTRAQNSCLFTSSHMSTSKRKTPTTTEVVVDTAKVVEEKVEDALTILWSDLPHWQQDNHYIHSGYRPASYSFQKSFASLGYLHNESVNIYSHLIAAVSFSISAIFLYTVIKPRYESATATDILAFGCFFLGAALCLSLSATYHTVSNHSPVVGRWGNKLDYVGIVCMITGSFIPSIFYGFYCHSHLQEIYWTMVRHLILLMYRSDERANVGLDLLTGSRMCNNIDLRSLPYSYVASLSSRHVCCHGTIRSVSSTSWNWTLWNSRDAGKNWAGLACASRLALHPRSWAVCCEFCSNEV